VAFFRGREPETSIWRRFRSGLDGFTFVRESDCYAARVVANAERTTDLFSVLVQHLPPAVDLAITDLRARRAWTGDQVALPDVQAAVGRLKVPLAASGGVEFAVYSTEDQVTLSPQLELFIYARSDRWLYLLLGLGLEERATLPTRSGSGAPQLGAAPEMSEAVAAAAERLGLLAVPAP
jgi:hypothetical protein